MPLYRNHCSWIIANAYHIYVYLDIFVHIVIYYTLAETKLHTYILTRFGSTAKQIRFGSSLPQGASSGVAKFALRPSWFLSDPWNFVLGSWIPGPSKGLGSCSSDQPDCRQRNAAWMEWPSQRRAPRLAAECSAYLMTWMVWWSALNPLG